MPDVQTEATCPRCRHRWVEHSTRGCLHANRQAWGEGVQPICPCRVTGKLTRGVKR